ncbi:hypothetical protein NP493_419g01003 [Ridgeia piscesae]|uniref:Uncharacterized protein n=1 Tax=Ridgeia piscesae TaxID=27915 RepID=A0AAD9L1C3_RIDPI|nr:hypothetical protein NP493_419g01003 [Ridgeia piscesae]
MLPDPENCHMYYGCDKVDKAGGVTFLHEYHFSCNEKYWSQTKLQCVDEEPEGGCAPALGNESSPAAVLGNESSPAAALGNESSPAAALGNEPSPAAALGNESSPAAALGNEPSPDVALGNEPSPDVALGNESSPDAAGENSDVKPLLKLPEAAGGVQLAEGTYNISSTKAPDTKGLDNSIFARPQAAAPAPVVAANDDPTDLPIPSLNCPYRPVPGRPDQFESKYVPGAIYTCPASLVFDFFFFPCGCFREKQSVVSTSPDECPYIPVAGFPAKFESKSVPGAIYTCPFGQVFDFDYFPCGCFPIANPTGPPPANSCPYVPVPGFPEQFASRTVVGAIYTCPVGQLFDFDFFPCGCFP